MKISELIEKDRQEQAKTLHQAEQIKQQNQNKKLTYYNFLKEKYNELLKNQNTTLQQKAQAKTKIFNIDRYIKAIQKDITKND